MALTKTIEIDGQEVTFRASAAIPRMYRVRFGKDLFTDLRNLQVETEANDSDASMIGISSLEAFENIAYIMAKHADPQGVPNEIDEWLDQFNTFSIYQILPEILTLWGMNEETKVTARKNLEALNGN